MTVLFGTLVLFTMVLASASDEPAAPISEESQKCLNCHGGTHYTLADSASGDEVNLTMYRELRIDPVKLTKGLTVTLNVLTVILQNMKLPLTLRV